MPDNDINVPSSGAPTAKPVATEDIGGVRVQRIKPAWGAHGVANYTNDADGERFPVGGAQIGANNETAPGTDTGAAGLNGRLQRIAQRLTTLITDIGDVVEAAPGTDTASSGLNGRLQRVAQRLTSILTQLTTGIIVQPREATVTITVAVGNNSSGAVDTAGYRYFGLIVPSNFDGTQIQFTVSDTLGGTYQNVFDIWGNVVAMNVAPSRNYDLPGELSEWRFLRIACVTVQATTNTDFILVMRS